MSDRDVMALLSEANPVRLEDVSQLDATLLDSILARRHRPSRRTLLVAVAVVGAAAAASIAVFAFGSVHRQQVAGRPELVPPPKKIPISLADASAAVGAPVVLPDTALANRSEVTSVTKECPGPGGRGTGCAVTITFSSRAVTARYVRGNDAEPFGYPGGCAFGQRRCRGAVHLRGVPALVIPEDPRHPIATATYPEFAAGGTTIAIVGHYSPAKLEPVAQSIIERSRS
jgi:hypothetical protein